MKENIRHTKDDLPERVAELERIVGVIAEGLWNNDVIITHELFDWIKEHEENDND